MADNYPQESGEVTYSPAIGAYVGTHDEEAPSVAIMETLAAIRDEDVTDLDPLPEAAAIDGEALDELFQPTHADDPRMSGRVEFAYEEYEIRVFCYRRIEIEPLNDDDERMPHYYCE